MYAYARRHFTAEETLGGVLGQRVRADRARCRPSCRPSSCSPTRGGAEFVGALRERAGGALDARGPRGALAPARLDRAGHAPGEVGAGRAAACRVRAARRRGARGRLGARGGRRARASSRRASCSPTRAAEAPPTAAAGWGGDRYELWRRGAGEPAVPRRGADRALALGHRRPTRASSRRSCASGCRTGSGAAPDGGTFGIDAGHVAVAARDGAVTLAMAPSGPLARRLAAAG